MELAEYIRIIKKEQKTILKAGALTAFFALIFSTYAYTGYEASVSLFLTKSGTQQTDEFKYDGYYALESGEIVSDNIEKWLKSPQVVSEIYSEARMDPGFRNIKNYKKKFTANKMSNQYVEVSFETDSAESAEKISSAINRVIKRKMNEMSAESEEEISFSVKETDPVIIEKKSNLPLNVFAGLFSGLFLGTFFVFLKRYLNKAK
ncbi:MAG: hypothetical protein PHI66_00720 [Candidatus Pacebacteria bacterium]|nr:hypothetical protein [Candidatus Paceibacterota bacterium]